MANETTRMSAVGMSELRRREGVVLRYYNDSANNCTFGAGTLAHLGGCTGEELSRTVTAVQVNASLAARVAAAEETVRRRVTRHPLTQDQFDSLVSFTFNAGPTGARRTLDAADRGSNADVAANMTNHVFVHPRDANGHRGRAIRSTGLASRRREEAMPFQAVPAAR
jgi:lysozyme